VPVHTGWDLGVSDSTAVWFIQNVGRSYHLIDYYESSGAPLGHYIDVLHEKRIKHRWRYARHFLPHDVKNRELNTAMSRIETLRSLGLESEVVPAHDKLDSVNAVRRMLDRTWIDPDRCDRGLDCLRNYRFECRDKQRIWTAYPLHDWASHGADALATFATGYEDPSITLGQKRRDRDYGSFSTASHWAS
jgi:phage terminase large subunit